MSSISVVGKEKLEEQMKSTMKNVAIIPQVHGESFQSEPILISAGEENSTPLTGKGEWTYLVALPFTGNPGQVLKLADSAWKCPYTDPYIQNGHVVWQFPKSVSPDPLPPEEQVEDEFYNIAFIPESFEQLFSEKWWCGKAETGSKNISQVFSYAETFCLTDSIFNFSMDETCRGKESLSLLVIGEKGVGVAWGLLWSLRKYLYGKPGIRRIDLTVVETSEKSLEGMDTVIESIRALWMEDISLRKIVHQPSAGNWLPDAISGMKADLMVISRWIGSRMSDGPGQEEAYRHFFSQVCGMMDENGLLFYIEDDDRLGDLPQEGLMASLPPGWGTLIPSSEDSGWWESAFAPFYVNWSRSLMENKQRTAFLAVGPQRVRRRLAGHE